jgi:hypothetical protein
MINVIMTRGHEYTLRNAVRDRQCPPLDVLDYDRLLAARKLPRAVYVFTDFDRLGPYDLELAAAVYRELAAAGAPVLNDPARFKTRYGLLRALHEAGINDFNAYRADEGLRPARYPVFIRRDHGHRAPLSDLLADWDATRRAIDEAVAEGVPESHILIVEYAAEPAAPGIFRKLSVARVGDRYTPQLCGHDETWLVKRGKKGGATEELYQDENRIMRENPFAKELARAFQLAEIEYGRADFGLVGGRVQVYEINSNPHFPTAFPHPIPLRAETQRLAWTQLRDALADLAGRAPRGRPIRVGHSKLARYQRRWYARARTRFVP